MYPDEQVSEIKGLTTVNTLMSQVAVANKLLDQLMERLQPVLTFREEGPISTTDRGRNQACALK